MKRWVFIIALLLMMVPMPAHAEDSVSVDVHRNDKVLEFHGYAGEDNEVFVDNLQLTARGDDVDRFRFTKQDLKWSGKNGKGGGEISRTSVKLAGDKTLQEDLPKSFPVIITTSVKKAGTYNGEAEIISTGHPKFHKPDPITLKLVADDRPSQDADAQVSSWASQMEALASNLETVARAAYIAFVLIVVFILGTLVVLVGADTGSVSKDMWSWLDYGNFYIVTWGIIAVVIGFVGILLFFDFEDATQALGFLTAFFGAIVGLVGTFFGIKSSSDATAEAQRAHREATRNGSETEEATSNGPDTPSGQIPSTDPPDNDDNVPRWV